MIYCYLKGGLGNMMFQISATIGIATKNNQKYGFANFTNHVKSLQHQYERSIDIDSYSRFFDRLKNKDVYPYSQMPVLSYPFYYADKPARDCVIDGYFQSERYFSDYRNQIIKTFNFDHVAGNMLNKYNLSPDNNNISLHIRRGDYLNLSEYHNILDLEYYYKAIDKIGSYDKIYIFSDDIEWCSDKFQNHDCIFVSEPDIESLFLMSISKHNIIANSSFSWWGAWLNTNQDKRVIAPKKWFGEKNNHIRTTDIYCGDWEIL